jgi:hypothetical protein
LQGTSLRLLRSCCIFLPHKGTNWRSDRVQTMLLRKTKRINDV